MAKHDNRLEGDPHQAISELIPWYVNDTLENDERERVAQHIAECPVCGYGRSEPITRTRSPDDGANRVDGWVEA